VTSTWPLARINETVSGKRATTADTALRGMSAERWLGLQMEYDIRRARRDVWPAIEPRIPSLTMA